VGVEKIFFTRSFPSAKQTQSVNVPPVSIAMRKSAALLDQDPKVRFSCEMSLNAGSMAGRIGES
jgi:hypothetical protein